MADAIINVEFVPGLGLPYTPGAESALAPGDALAFDAVSADRRRAADAAFRHSRCRSKSWRISSAPRGKVGPSHRISSRGIDDSVRRSRQMLSSRRCRRLPFVLQAARQSPAVVAGWEVATDPDSLFQRYLRTGPAGVSAYLAWQMPGGGGRGARVADVEHGWDLRTRSGGVVTALTFLPGENRSTSIMARSRSASSARGKR